MRSGLEVKLEPMRVGRGESAAANRMQNRDAENLGVGIAFGGHFGGQPDKSFDTCWR